MIYVISYNINTTERNYSELYTAIKSIGSGFYHPLESVWFVSAQNTNVDEISRYLKQYLSPRDNIMTIEFAKGSKIQGWLPKNFWEWFDNHKDK